MATLGRGSKHPLVRIGLAAFVITFFATLGLMLSWIISTKFLYYFSKLLKLL